MSHDTFSPPCEEAFKGEHGLWKIEINSLAHLTEFSRKYKTYLIYDEDSIIIYDDYME